MYKIRDYRPSDFPHIENIWQLTGMGGAARGDNAQTIEKSLNSEGRFLVLTADEQVIGTSWLTSDTRRIYLHHFGIHPDFQGKGLSKMLLEASLAHVKQVGLQVKLEVHQNNQKALSLYEKYGFLYLGDYKVYIIRDINQI
jgi:ribosomal protein S18 acetylase RimI-like enzyme